MQQSNQVSSLESYLRTITAKGRVSHAYLRESPSPDMGLAIAQKFAQMLLCDTGDGCGTCKNCKMVQSFSHPDLQTVQPPEDKKQISVAQVRDVVSESYVKPYMGKPFCFVTALL